MLYAGSVVDCLVLDISSTGIRISTDAVIPFPEEVRIELRSGGVWVAQRRWQRGLESGFEILRFSGLHAQAMGDASALYDRVIHAGIREVIGRLEEVRFFDHPELKETALAAREAVDALEQAMRIASGRT